MTVICKAFRASPLPSGELKLEIEDPQQSTGLDPNGTKLLYIPDVARVLRKSADTIYKMGKRKKNPIPFIRGRGRPFVVEGTLARFLTGSLPSSRRAFVV